MNLTNVAEQARNQVWTQVDYLVWDQVEEQVEESS